MLQNYNKYKMLRVFLNNPTESFRLRELCRIVEISPLSVKNYLDEFIKEGLIIKYEKRKVPFYRALRDNIKFKRCQQLSGIYELYESGLIDDLWDKINPQAIIFYGSYFKGDAIENSDIDLFVIGKEKDIDIKKYEKRLGRNIQILYSINFKNIPKELKNNLINGIVLKGYLTAF